MPRQRVKMMTAIRNIRRVTEVKMNTENLSVCWSSSSLQPSYVRDDSGTPANAGGYTQYLSDCEPARVTLVSFSHTSRLFKVQSQMYILCVISRILNVIKTSGSGEKSWFPDKFRFVRLCGKSPGERWDNRLEARLSLFRDVRPLKISCGRALR